MKLVLATIIIAIVSLVAQWIPGVPWWSFLIPCFLLGLVVPFEKWKVPSFVSGLLAGALVWLGMTIIYHYSFRGEILDQVCEIFGLPYPVYLLVVGIIGGLLTGLSVYSGFMLRKGNENYSLYDE